MHARGVGDGGTRAAKNYVIANPSLFPYMYSIAFKTRTSFQLNKMSTDKTHPTCT